MIEVKTIAEDSQQLDEVKALWRQNSQMLGFFPSGAFAERARKGQILAAFDGHALLGYVLYYSDKNSRVRITHLCVSDTCRGKGVARALISALRSATKAYRGIGLHCRRDFPAWNLWPKLGFQAVKEKIGQSKDGHELTFFWQSHPHKSLFSECSDLDESQVSIVLDANVFYDLLDSKRMEAEESLGLSADWLQPAIRLCVTPELSNEIQRNPNSAERATRMASARRFVCVEATHEDFESARQSVEHVCGASITERDSADQRQLAWTIASSSDVFVTRDQCLLDHADELYRVHGVTVERPAEVISRFEELRNEHEYQRDRLAGTDVRISRQSSDADSLAEAFLANSQPEKKAELARLLNLAFANPDRFSCKVVYGNASAPLCMYLIERQQLQSCNIRLFRLHRTLTTTRLGGTLVRTILATIVQEAAEAGTLCIHATEPYLDPVVKAALQERRFALDSGRWSKLCLNETVSLEGVHGRLQEVASATGLVNEQLSQVLDDCRMMTLAHDASAVLELERLIWPGKISGTKVPNFVIPIRPEWASDLFEGRLAKQRLWGADIDLVLNPDSVYYRAEKPRVLSSPGRILWYVSEGKAQGSKMLRACSQLTGVQVGGPKDLFRRFRRFGVYEWRHVLETAGSVEGRLMAIEFTNTELFRKPLDWESLQQVLRAHGKENYTFPSPVEIDESLFFSLYRHGTALESHS